MSTIRPLASTGNPRSCGPVVNAHPDHAGRGGRQIRPSHMYELLKRSSYRALSALLSTERPLWRESIADPSQTSPARITAAIIQRMALARNPAVSSGHWNRN